MQSLNLPAMKTIDSNDGLLLFSLNLLLLKSQGDNSRLFLLS